MSTTNPIKKRAEVWVLTISRVLSGTDWSIVAAFAEEDLAEAVAAKCRAGRPSWWPEEIEYSPGWQILVHRVQVLAP